MKVANVEYKKEIATTNCKLSAVTSIHTTQQSTNFGTCNLSTSVKGEAVYIPGPGSIWKISTFSHLVAAGDCGWARQVTCIWSQFPFRRHYWRGCPQVTSQESTVVNATKSELRAVPILYCWNHYFRDIWLWCRKHGAMRHLSLLWWCIFQLFHSLNWRSTKGSNMRGLLHAKQWYQRMWSLRVSMQASIPSMFCTYFLNAPLQIKTIWTVVHKLLIYFGNVSERNRQDMYISGKKRPWVGNSDCEQCKC